MNYKHLLVKKRCDPARVSRARERAPRQNKIWIWTALDKDYSNILEYVIGDRSAETFKQLWSKVKEWNCYFWITDGYKVYPKFIPDGEQIVSQTSMTRIEGENSRLRHYLARLHRKTFCYSRVKRNAIFVN